jgi:hypothetical protein
MTGSLAINGTTAIVGSGTANYVPKFTASGTIGSSIIQEVSSSIGIEITPSANVGNLQIGGTANTSLFTQQGTDTVRIGVRASGRSGIAIDSSNVTYTNRMWYIDNNGANGSLYIGRSGLDVLTLANTGVATFSGEIKSGDTITLGAAAVGGFWTWGSTIAYLVAGTGKALNLNPNGVSGTTGLSIATTGKATFSADMLVTSDIISNYGIAAARNGSNTQGSGPYFLLSNAAFNQLWYQQLNASNNIDYWYNGSVKMTLTTAGNVNINGSGFSDVKFYVKGSDATSSNYAALFVNGSGTNLFNIRNDGAVTVFGSLSKGSGSFRIKHPLISKKNTHQLVHSFIEGPQADLIYRGKIRLNAGKAIINIDEASTMTEGTFEALCREVQCFTTNETGWDAVKGKVTGNILTIESQNTESTDEISWMVVGERQDEHMIDTEWTDDEGKVIVEPLITE